MKKIVSHLSNDIIRAIDDETGYNDLSLSFEEWSTNQENFFKKHHITVTEQGYEFEDEIYYTWMILNLTSTRI